MSGARAIRLRSSLASGLGVLIDPVAARRGAARAERTILAGVAVLTVLHCLYFFNQACDDGYISLGYARRWVEGRGLTLNDVAPSEGYSNLLWVMVLAAGMRVGLDGLVVAKLAGLICATATPLVAVRLARSCGGGIWSQAAAGIFVGTATPMAAWSCQALETPLYALEVAVLALLANRLGRRWGRMLFTLTACAMTLTRPEGYLVAGGLCLSLRVLGQRWRIRRKALWCTLIIITAVVVAHQVFRVHYFGRWVGNSALHKWHPMAVGSFAERALGRIEELTEFYWSTATPAVWLILLLPLRMRWTRRRVLPAALLLAAVVAFQVLVGGDIGPFVRFLVPGFALTGVLLSRIGSFRPARSWLGQGVRLTGPVLAIVLGVSGMASMLRWVPLPSNFYAAPSLIRPTAHAEVAAWLRQSAEPNDRLLLSEMGLIPYASDLPCFDYLGLCDRYMYERGADFQPDRYDQHRPTFVMLGLVLLPGGQVSARLPAGNRILTETDFTQKFVRVAEFSLDKQRSLMEHGYYGNRPDVRDVRFVLFRRRDDLRPSF